MIKFFRRIRQKLLAENRFSKYLIYAIGEIILVVIGILIALQVNNWNNSLKEKSLEIKILEDLKIEFEANKKDANRIMDVHISIAHAMEAIQKQIEISSNNQKVLDSLIPNLLSMPYYTPKPGASQNLINSGNLNVLSNENLRNQLILWSGIVDDLHDDEEDGLHLTRNIFIPFLTENYPLINFEKDYFLFNHNRIKTIESTELTSSLQEKSINIVNLYNNLTFQNQVHLKKLASINSAIECKPVINAAESISELISLELESLKND